LSHVDGRTRPSPELLVAAVGAALFACDEPVGTREIAEAFGDVPLEELDDALGRLQRALDQAETGLRVESVAGGFQLSTRPEVGPWVRRFFRQRNRTRLSPAALETLAIVAYRQPVTAPEIQAIRGKDPSAALKTLLDKRLLRLLGRKKVVGNPLLYGTSKEFLVHFGLNGLADLPAIEDFDGFAEGLAVAQGSDQDPEEDGQVESDDPAELPGDA
jgi:segregation and condensation protein B